MKYAHLEKNTNILLGWYDDSVHKEIPIPNIKVDEKVWQEAIDINANYYENGIFIAKDFITDKEIETQRVNSIKIKARDLIESKYPFYKQLNITNLLDGYTEKDKTDMIDYINLIRKISNEAETNKTQPEDISWK